MNQRENMLSLLLRDNIRNITPYSTARDDCKAKMDIYLDANENPYPNGVNRYPSPHQPKLKEMLSVLKHVPAENIFIGNGRDEPIDLIFRLFCPPGESSMVQIVPTYGMYSVAAAINDVRVIDAPLDGNFTLDAAAVLSKVEKDTKAIFLCSPNNPSGNLLDRGQILHILDNFDGIVVVDEAYIDFADGESFIAQLGKYPRLVVLQTMSKAWGMAGLRIGIAVADKFIVDVMSRIKYPYNVSVLNQSKAEELLSDPLAAADKVAEIKSERNRLATVLSDMDSVVMVYPSDANFILVKCSDAEGLYTELIRNRIIVRDRSRVPGCEGCLRISVGTPEENTRLICAVDEWSSRLSSSRPGALSSGTGIPVSVNTLDTEDEAGLPAEKRAGDPARKAAIFRTTSETAITAIIDLDGKGPSFISTGIGFFDHMLDQIVHHGGISMLIYARGDLNVDEHHTIEDVAITLGKAVSDALGSKAGIGRYGFVLPMDESDASVLLDLGGRIDFRWDAGFAREKIGDMPTEMFSHFFKSFAESARCNLHISARGENEHHKIEGIFKAFARALKMAIARDGSSSLPSSKGIL